MRPGVSVRELARELGVHFTQLYRWKRKAEERSGRRKARPGGLPLAAARLEEELRQAKQLLAEKTLEIDFFKGALQKVEARRQSKGGSGETASTIRSGK